MEWECTPLCRAIKFFVLGLFFILARIYWPTWDLFLIVGVLLIIKAAMVFIMPKCPCCKTEVKPKKK